LLLGEVRAQLRPRLIGQCAALLDLVDDAHHQCIDRIGDVADPVDALVVRVVDEVEKCSTLTDETWSQLRSHFTEQQA
ncbi:hypothetical protein C6A85_06605, partial [Mycobacterium sp. ITM-2017-0098]